MDGGVDVDCGDDCLVVFSFPPWRSSAIEPDPGPGGSRAKNNNVARRDDDAPLLQELGSQRSEFGSVRRIEDGQSNSSVRSIRTIEEYEVFVLDEKDKLVIVRFHAPWCKVRVCYEHKIERR